MKEWKDSSVSEWKSWPFFEQKNFD